MGAVQRFASSRDDDKDLCRDKYQRWTLACKF